MYVCHMSCVPDVHGGQTRGSDPLELSYRLFQVAQYLQRTKSRSSARGASAPNS